VPDPAPDNPRRALLLRAFRLSGLFPLPAFLVLHAAVNARALAGDAAFLDASRQLQSIPLLSVAEVVFVLAPLALHAAVGSWILAARIPLPAAPPLPRAVRTATRAAGVAILLFLVLHLSELRFRAGWSHPAPATLLATLDSRLSSMFHGLPLRAVAYLLASACVCFHLAVGFWGAFAGSPRGEAPQARRRAAWWSASVGVILWLLLSDIVVFHATGARLFGSASAEPQDTNAPCPPPSASTPPPPPAPRPSASP
jgi:succinate dehydrogenase / fumarate reductase cytochrome b subunit